MEEKERGDRKLPVSRSPIDNLKGHGPRLLVTESLHHLEQQAILSESGKCQRDGGIQALYRQGRAPRRPQGALGIGNSAPKPVMIRFSLLRQDLLPFRSSLKNGLGALDTPGTFAFCFINRVHCGNCRHVVFVGLGVCQPGRPHTYSHRLPTRVPQSG